MESPVRSLSRSSSFAPGPHRRSHPNLHHLSLAPLTPKYPIDPADYDAYFDPSTSELHTSASISQISGLPSPGGILTSHSAAHSRASSRTRLKRKTKSSVSVHGSAATAGSQPHQAHLEAPSGALTSEGFGHRKANRVSSGLRIHMSDSSWLIQTGLALTEGSRESKGQSWIVKRDSSTSLASPSYVPTEERATHSSTHPSRSARATPSISRRSSFKRGSRRSLAITPALHTPLSLGLDEPDSNSMPDWADDRTQAEIAAQVGNDLAEEFDYDGDPYGVLDFEGQFDSDEDNDSDEEEVRREILASGFHMGSWVDGIVDVFLRLEDPPDSSSEQNLDLETGSRFPSREMPANIDAAQLPSSGAENGEPKPTHFESDNSVEPPPVQQQGGLWNDVAWFGRLVARTVRS
ncbi:uncharacterized protein A1O9_07451 [Exophiala aquamarina CBS 119918]|uniref:Uncharacterized protein n=1 Tax=Exophiala aquamarina CBS 119918 TaxID=1182545 RepID=A0A072P7Q2_9EURO|nr:uncharacterized protein A1O9_07451 [Exophiala aquamarina CBS 119918]KEF55871.1 hypothetical protein A1O9_07451 [Exophiala aquamarina CBS 119918]